MGVSLQEFFTRAIKAGLLKELQRRLYDIMVKQIGVNAENHPVFKSESYACAAETFIQFNYGIFCCYFDYRSSTGMKSGIT